MKLVTKSINLTIHETYDLNTKVDKISLLAIRTPSFKTVEKYISLRNWQKVKFNSASFRLACVSQLPVDPLGVGFESGQIAPQELVNPMLFKTVTGDSLGPILDVIYGPDATKDEGNSLRSFDVDKVIETQINENSPNYSNSPLDMYYVLLGDDSFRQVHPQQGITAHGIIPMVREMLSTMPLQQSNHQQVGIGGNTNINNYYEGPNFVDGVIGANPGSLNVALMSGRQISGPIRPMPAIDTYSSSKNLNFQQHWPMSYCAVCIMPPAIQKSLYYRCIVSWNITLSSFIPSFRTNAYLGSTRADLYTDWVDTPVSNSVAAANELWEQEGMIATDGINDVNMVTQNLT